MDELKWRRVGPTPRVGPIQFLADGGFKVVGTGAVFAKNNRLTNCRVGPATQFDFHDGKTRLENDDAVHHLQFVGQEGWEYAVVSKRPNVEAGTGGTGWMIGAAFVMTGLLAWLFAR